MGYKTLPNGVNIYDQDSFKYLKESGRIANLILKELLNSCTSGTTPLDLENLANNLINKYKVKPAFKGFEGYPNSVCVSYNEKIVHGVPNAEYKFKKGDVVSIDFGVIYNKHYSDNARTIIVDGNSSSNHAELLNITEQAFYDGLNHCKIGNKIGDISYNIHKRILSVKVPNNQIHRGTKYKAYFKFQGHGIGCKLHEDPPIPNIGHYGKGLKLQEGMCICIEPVVLYSSSNPIEFITKDSNFKEIHTDNKLPSAHFENQIFITQEGPVILTNS